MDDNTGATNYSAGSHMYTSSHGEEDGAISNNAHILANHLNCPDHLCPSHKATANVYSRKEYGMGTYRQFCWLVVDFPSSALSKRERERVPFVSRKEH